MDAGQLEKATHLVEAHLPKSLVAAAGPASLNITEGLLPSNHRVRSRERNCLSEN